MTVTRYNKYEFLYELDEWRERGTPMPRRPTGRPTGRPKGSGLVLAEAAQVRLTVRLERSLYDRLDAYAAGRTYHRGTPQLARCVREALVEYLERREKRQTESPPRPCRGEYAADRKSDAHAGGDFVADGKRDRAFQVDFRADTNCPAYARASKRHNAADTNRTSSRGYYWADTNCPIPS
jgi:hypothetical protein